MTCITYHTVNLWVIAGMVTVCEQCYWMHEVSYYCGPHIGCQFLSCGFFVSLYRNLMHWAHGIEDNNTLDVDGYYYLFHSPTVRTRCNKRGYLRACLRGLQNNKKVMSTNINKLQTECDPLLFIVIYNT